MVNPTPTNTKIKLMHIISGDLWAGAESQVYNTLLALKSYDDILVTCVLFNDGILKNKLDSIGIKTYVLDETENDSVKIFIKLHKLVKIFRPHIIHVHHTKEHLLGLLCTCTHHFKRIAIIRTMHGMHGVRPGLPLLQRLRSSVVVWIDSILLKFFTDTVIAVSKDLMLYLQQKNLKANISVIHNALDVDHYVTAEKRSDRSLEAYRPSKGFWIGTAARLVRPKNLGMLIDAGTILKTKGIPFQISIFGDGPLKNELQKRITSLGLQKEIRLHGFVDGVLDIIDALDVFVLCSSHEGLPMALLESMLIETPVICTNVGGMKEVVEHEVNGLLVRHDDVEGLAGALMRLYNDKNLSNIIKKNAKQTILERFSAKISTKRLVTIYREKV